MQAASSLSGGQDTNGQWLLPSLLQFRSFECRPSRSEYLFQRCGRWALLREWLYQYGIRRSFGCMKGKIFRKYSSPFK